MARTSGRALQRRRAEEAALKAAKTNYTLYMYEGAQHAFHNDTGERYHKEAAQLAWQRTINFLNEKLKIP